MKPEVEAFIAHYGVKGMRWGVRNERGEGVRKLTKPGKKKEKKGRDLDTAEKAGTKTKAKEAGSVEKLTATKKKLETGPEETPDKTNASNLYGGSYRGPSDMELRAAVSRMQLEKQYKQLMEEAQPKKKKNKGLQIAGDVLVNVGKQQATNLLNKSIENQINKAFQVKADPKLLKKAEGMDLADLRKAVQRKDLTKKFAGGS